MKELMRKIVKDEENMGYQKSDFEWSQSNNLSGTGKIMHGDIFVESGNPQINVATHYLDQKISSSERHIVESVEIIDQKIDKLKLKKRRKLQNQGVGALNDGSIVFVNYYDDGSMDSDLFITNVRGPIEIYRIKFEEENDEEFFAICFLMNHIWILGRYEKVTANYLYNLFMKAGIIFNCKMSENSVKKILYTALVSVIEHPLNSLYLSKRAGWNAGEFITNSNFCFAGLREAQEFPVMKKSFSQQELGESRKYNYFRTLNSVIRIENRIFLSIYPYAAIIATILRKNGFPIKIAANMIVMDETSLADLCVWFQTFERESIQPKMLKNARTEIENSKDEIILLDCYNCKNAYEYKKNKMLRKSIYDIWVGRSFDTSLCVEDINSGLVFFAKDIMLERGITNLFFSEDTIRDFQRQTKLLKECKTMEAVWSTFVAFIKNNSELLNDIFQQNEQFKDSCWGFMQVTYEIVKKFWQMKKISFDVSLDFPKIIEWEAIFSSTLYAGEDLMELFVKATRKAASQYRFLHKTQKIEEDEIIRYDEQYLWISKKIYEEILFQSGLNRYAKQILVEAKESGILITSAEGYLKRIQINKRELERYQFKRSYFNGTGLVEIVELGKEAGNER